MSVLRRIIGLFVQPAGARPPGPPTASPPAPKPSAAPARLTEEAIIQELRGVIIKRSGGQLRAGEIHASDHLFEGGFIDSMRSAELLEYILQRHGLELPESTLLGRDGTLRGMARLILESLAQRD